MPQTSIQLLARLRSGGDPVAWSTFVERYGPPVIRWCRLRGLQDADAHDVAQEVLLKVSRQISRLEYDPSRSFRGWLRSVAYCAWADWMRRDRSRLRGSGGPDALRLLEEVEARDDLATQFEAEYDRELFELASGRVRERVAPETWEAFRLTAIDGLSAEEAAGRLGVRLSAIYSSRKRVRDFIREEVRGLDPDR